MLIPSIDLMGGKIVQLIQGKEKALEFDDFEPWIERFSRYPLVQLIDLDAALGQGNNRGLLPRFTMRLVCQVGGGIRSIDAAQRVLDAGARRIILGSALVRDGQVNSSLACEFAQTFGSQKLVCAVDSRRGNVAIRGWRTRTRISALQMVQLLEPWCAAFLYTHIDTEGLLRGIPLEIVESLRAATLHQLIVAGGICSLAEIERLHALGADAVVGMAVYRGLVPA